MKSITQNRFRVAVALLVMLGAIAFSGCQTMKGAGKDMERAGEKIQENAEKHD